MRLSHFIAALFVCLSLDAAPPSTQPAPSRMIFGGFGETYGFEGLVFQDPSQVFTRILSIPPDGAWLFGRAGYDGSEYMDCSHHYVGLLQPNATVYEPFFSIGATSRDACLSGRCFSCSIRYGTIVMPQYFTTPRRPAFVPGSSNGAALNVKTLNQPPSDVLTIWLAQVNADAMTGLTVFHAASADDPGPATEEEIDARTYTSDSDDRVLLVPEFEYGTERFPATPETTFQARWDTGVLSHVEVRRPVRNGHVVLSVAIPTMKTGRHDVTIMAALPSGRTFSAPAVKLYTYEKNVFVDLDGNFSLEAPVDDIARFFPGTDINGSSLDLRTTSQAIGVHILVPKGAPGTLKVELDESSISRWPGIAMNYPLENGSTAYDMDLGSGVLSREFQLPRSNRTRHVPVTLNVHDYAASGRLRVTIPTRTGSRIVMVTLPTDDNGNGLPDRGWSDDVGTAVADSADPKQDSDAWNHRGVAEPAETVSALVGDGLSRLEEYRGFFVNNRHRRLHPEFKDVFVDVDAPLLIGSALRFLTAIPLRMHYLVPGEARCENLLRGSRRVPRINCEMNPNRLGMPGVRRQRAVRLARTILAQEPNYYIRASGDTGPLSHYLPGASFPIGSDLEYFPIPYDGPRPGPPSETHLSEVYSAFFVSQAMAYGENRVADSVLDEHGSLVKICPDGNPLCDEENAREGFRQRYGYGRPILSTLLTRVNPRSDDYYTMPYVSACHGMLERSIASPAEVSVFADIVAAHEAAHSMGMQHTSDCEDIMSEGVAGVFPIPTRFSERATGSIRLQRSGN